MMMTLKELVEALARQRHLRKRHARQYLLGYIWSCLYDGEREHIIKALLFDEVKNNEPYRDQRWYDGKPTPDDTPETEV